MEKIIKSFFGNREIREDPDFVQGFAEYLTDNFSQEERIDIYGQFKSSDTKFHSLMRRIVIKAIFKKTGTDVIVHSGFSFAYPETIELGNGVFIGQNSSIFGRIEGSCKIGNRVWIGPYSFLDARDLVIEDFVGWGPGAKVLGSEHGAYPVDIPVIQTDLQIKPVRIGRGCDIGMNAVILPGITIGEGAIVGAGAVVTRDVEPYTVVSGVPAKFMKKR